VRRGTRLRGGGLLLGGHRLVGFGDGWKQGAVVLEQQDGAKQSRGTANEQHEDKLFGDVVLLWEGPCEVRYCRCGDGLRAARFSSSQGPMLRLLGVISLRTCIISATDGLANASRPAATAPTIEGRTGRAEAWAQKAAPPFRRRAGLYLKLFTQCGARGARAPLHHCFVRSSLTCSMFAYALQQRFARVCDSINVLHRCEEVHSLTTRRSTSCPCAFCFFGQIRAWLASTLGRDGLEPTSGPPLCCRPHVAVSFTARHHAPSLDCADASKSFMIGVTYCVSSVLVWHNIAPSPAIVLGAAVVATPPTSTL
jgi:hypothetical protein